MLTINEKPRAFDILGNIIIVKFPNGLREKSKRKFAENILKTHKTVRTVLEKSEKFKGRLRKQKTKFILGEKTKEAVYKENNCIFRFNVDKVYFSPRLSNERKEISSKIRKNDEVLVMFAGVSPFSIVIAKNSKAKVVYSNEINKEANKYARLNIELNNVKNKVFLLPGDIKKVVKKIRKKFDVIVMPRPNLKDTFLKQAFILSKKGTRIFYYDFCKEESIDEVVEKIKKEAKKSKKKIKIIEIKRAGEIAPHKFRVRVDFKVL